MVKKRGRVRERPMLGNRRPNRRHVPHKSVSGMALVTWCAPLPTPAAWVAAAGWTIVGKKDTCPTCWEKVDLRSLYADRPWETRNLSWWVVP